MKIEFEPHPNELAVIASLVYPTARDPKKAVQIAEAIAREAHARAHAIHDELEKKHAAERK